VSVSVQTFLLETRKLGLQEALYLGLGAVRGYREGSVSRADVRRREHVGNHRGNFDHWLVAWAFRISRIHRFISHFAGRRPRSPGFAFRLWAKGQRIGDRYCSQKPSWGSRRKRFDRGSPPGSATQSIVFRSHSFGETLWIGLLGVEAMLAAFCAAAID
jgi:hypothetical protein